MMGSVPDDQQEGILSSSYCSDCDNSVQGFTFFDFASCCLDADQVSQVLEVEEHQLVAKVQER